MISDIRWQQRFENFEKAFLLLKSPFKERREFSDLEQEGIVQRFEYTFELAWKVLKDYLEYGGVKLEESTPRNVIKEALSVGIIQDGHDWIAMLTTRNNLSHRYDNVLFSQAIDNIEQLYIPAMEKFYLMLKAKIRD